MKSLAVKLVLIVNDKMIGTVGEGNNRGVRERPTETPSHCYSEADLVIFWCKLRDIELLRVHGGYLIEALVFRFILFLVLHNFGFKQLIL